MLVEEARCRGRFFAHFWLRRLGALSSYTFRISELGLKFGRAISKFNRVRVTDTIITTYACSHAFARGFLDRGSGRGDQNSRQFCPCSCVKNSLTTNDARVSRRTQSGSSKSRADLRPQTSAFGPRRDVLTSEVQGPRSDFSLYAFWLSRFRARWSV